MVALYDEKVHGGFEMVTIVGRKVKAKVDDNLYGVR